MNIFFMNGTGIAVWGGSEKWMFNTGLALRARGHNVYYGGRKNSLFLEKCSAENFEILSLNISSDFHPLVIKNLRKFFSDHKIDVVVTEQNKDIRYTGFASKLNGNKVLIARTGLPSIKNKFRYRILLSNLLDGIVVTTDAIKEKYLSYNWIDSSSIKTIHDGIITSSVSNEEIRQIKHEFNIPDNKFVIGIFGKLIKKKQPNIFLEIAAEIVKEFPDTIFLMVGDGPEMSALRKYAYELGIVDNLFMVGFQSNPFPFYSICNLVVNTSQQEGIPNSLMEAMSLRKAAVAFNVGGVSELISQNENGILIPPNDIYLMTQRIKELMLDPDWAETLGNRAYERIQQHFSFDEMVNALEDYFRERLENKRGKSDGHQNKSTGRETGT